MINIDEIYKKYESIKVEWENQKYIYKILNHIKNKVIDKILVIKAMDSSPVSLIEEEISEGWYKENEIVYSPKITKFNSMPYFEFDEWYIIDQPKKFSFEEIYVNFDEFDLIPKNDFYKYLLTKFWTDIIINDVEIGVINGNNGIIIIGKKRYNLKREIENILTTAST